MRRMPRDTGTNSWRNRQISYTCHVNHRNAATEMSNKTGEGNAKLGWEFTIIQCAMSTGLTSGGATIPDPIL